MVTINLQLRRMVSKRRARLQGVHPSRATELHYKAELLKINERFTAAIKSEVLPDLLGFAQGLAADALPPDIASKIRRIARSQTEKLAGPAEALARNIANKAATQADKDIHKQMQDALGVNVSLARTPKIEAAFKQAVKDNVALIKSIPGTMGDDLNAKLAALFTESHAAGYRWEAISQIVDTMHSNGEYRSRLIARDQTSKINSSMNKVRQQGLGLTKYKWSASMDERTREQHAEADGHIFSWDEDEAVDGSGVSKPLGVADDQPCDPGVDIQCRCVAIPVFEDEEEPKVSEPEAEPAPESEPAPEPEPVPEPAPAPVPEEPVLVPELKELHSAAPVEPVSVGLIPEQGELHEGNPLIEMQTLLDNAVHKGEYDHILKSISKLLPEIDDPILKTQILEISNKAYGAKLDAPKAPKGWVAPGAGAPKPEKKLKLPKAKPLHEPQPLAAPVVAAPTAQIVAPPGSPVIPPEVGYRAPTQQELKVMSARYGQGRENLDRQMRGITYEKFRDTLGGEGVAHSAAFAYSGNDYKKINASLRTPGKVKNRYVKGVDEALEIHPRLAEDTLLYRGNPFLASRVSEMVPGAIITDPGFWSTSTNEKIAKGFALSASKGETVKETVIMRIHAPAGTKSIVVGAGGAVGGANNGLGEAEVILSRNTKTRVIGPIDSQRTPTGKIIHYVDVEVVP